MSLSRTTASPPHILNLTPNLNLTLPHQAMRTVFNRSSSDVAVRLAGAVAVTWRSTVASSETRLSHLPREILTSYLLPALERHHVPELVHAALLYLAIARDGLSDSELLDVLSLDDAVLKACTADAEDENVHRAPALFWSALKADLLNMGLLAVTLNHGRDLLQLPRRAFGALVRSYVARDADALTRAHRTLAEYFSGQWHGMAKPWVTQDGGKRTGERGLPEQPCVYVGGEVHVFNRRKLRELPYHLMAAGLLDVLDHQCLFNIEFLDATLRCLGSSALLVLFHDAVRVQRLQELSEQGVPVKSTPKRLHSMPLPNGSPAPTRRVNATVGDAIDARLAVLDALRLSRHVLAQHPDQLAAQLLGRLQDHTSQIDIKRLLETTEALARAPATYRCAPMQRCLAAPGGVCVAAGDARVTPTALALSAVAPQADFTVFAAAGGGGAGAGQGVAAALQVGGKRGGGGEQEKKK